MQKSGTKYINAVENFHLHFPTSTLTQYGIIVLCDVALYTCQYVIICYRTIMSDLNSCKLLKA